LTWFEFAVDLGISDSFWDYNSTASHVYTAKHLLRFYRCHVNLPTGLLLTGFSSLLRRRSKDPDGPQPVSDRLLMLFISASRFATFVAMTSATATPLAEPLIVKQDKLFEH
jgi:hypothetical protein